jgi:hypothetical protein
MKYLKTLLFLFFLPQSVINAQVKKSVDALRIDSPLQIDGILDESCYSEVLPAKDFVQVYPYNGQPARQENEVWFFYDQEAVYLGAMLYDTSPDSIYNLLTERDERGFADYFGVYLDPYNQGQLAYGYFITPTGVQMDIKALKDGQYDMEDPGWDAVWESASNITGNGWVVEMKIPYSSLRFPEVSEHTWGLNMFRRIRRYNSNNSWNQISREVSGFIDQQGELKGISNIKPPVRLSVSPYAATYLEMKGDAENPDFVYKGGMDLKYGLDESFTLDMMLVPDFGQIQSDDQELNLSPYELFYDEKRQFFTEGTELFGRAGIFYSRRIGAAPKFAYRAEDDLQNNEIVDYSPSETQLLNATKISGRSSGGWGLGVLNAMTMESNARIKDTISGGSRELLVQPFTNYNVSVVDKSLINNSYVSLINTNVAMAGDPFLANATAYDFQLKNKQKTYAIKGVGGLSYRRDGKSETGYGSSLGISKIKGKFMFDIEQGFLDDKLEINDLGYMQRNNEVKTSIDLNYNINEPFSVFNFMQFEAQWEMMRVYNPWDIVGYEIETEAIAEFRNNYVVGLFSGYGTQKNDYYESHVDGRYFRGPAYASISGFISTDSKKILVGEAELTEFDQLNTDGHGGMMSYEVSFRVGQRFRMEYDLNFENFVNDYGFVDLSENEDTIYFAKRNVHSVANTIEASYVLNNKMGFNIRTRHYWSGADNMAFYELEKDGSLTIAPYYSENQNQNYNAFSVDMRFRWIFAPGSELSLAWKNTIFDNTDLYRKDYFGNLRDTWNLGQTNSISLKVLYYIDYNHIASRNKT